MQLDLHVHSKSSFDSFMEPVRIIRVARRRGLQGVAIVDHDTIRGGIASSRLNQHKDFMVIVGSEVSTNRGDIIGLFLTEEVKSRDAEAAINEIREQGGISVLAHPFKRGRVKTDLLEKLDAIEGFNARFGFQSLVSKALRTARANQLPVTAGSDAHFYFEIGRGRCVIEDAIDEEDVRRGIMRGETKIEGILTSPYVELLSQVVRSFKEREPKLLLTNVAKKCAYITYSGIREMQQHRHVGGKLKAQTAD